MQAAFYQQLDQILSQIKADGFWKAERLIGTPQGPAIHLADGREVSLARHWSAAGPEAAFLREVRDGACRWLRAVLGPDHNAEHRDHFHLDEGPFRVCR